MKSIFLDFSRCIAIILLLLAHISQTIKSPIGSFFGIPNFYYVSIGGLAVTIFLIISGSVLELNYGDKDNKYCSFIFKRFLRIYPIYYLSLLLGILIYIIRDFSDTGNVFISLSKFDFKDIILSLTGGYAFGGEWGGPFISTSWFIALIMSLYLLFPFISFLMTKKKNTTLIFLFIISFISRVILGNSSYLPTRPIDWFPLCRIFEFSLGIYFSKYFSNISLNILTRFKYIKSSVGLFSELSFPLFLIHQPLLFLINFLSKNGVNLFLSIFIFIIISIFISWIVLNIDKKIPKHYVLGKIK